MWSQEAEQAVIGAILTEPRLLDEVSALISERDFYADKHRVIYSALKDMSLKGEGIDALTVSQHMGKDADEVGGFAYLLSLTQMQAHRQQEAKFDALSHELQMCAREVGSHYAFHEAEALLDLPITLRDYLKARYFLVEEMCQEADGSVPPDLAGEAIEIADAVLKEFFTEVAHSALLALTSEDTGKVACEIHRHALDAKKYACLWYKKAARESGTHNISNDSIPYAAAGGEGRYTAI